MLGDALAPPVIPTTVGVDFRATLSAENQDDLIDQYDFESPPSSVDLRRELCDQNLFIFHLPSEWRETEVKSAFSPFGEILSAKVVKRPDGSSKGYGFVCYEHRESAIAAVEAMNGFCVGSKRLKVSLKKTPEECLNLQVQKLLRMSDHQDHYDRERDCSLFVFHLPPHWDDKDLKDKFLPFGSVVAAKVSRKDDGTSRGYGFVTCADPRAAAMAILHLNGLEVCNKRLKVQPKQVGNGPHPRPDCTVFVFHLPNDWTDSILRQFFSNSGRVLSATVQRDLRGRSRGFGFVTFDNPHSAAEAVNDMNGVKVGIKRLKVSLKRSASSFGGSCELQCATEDWQDLSPAEEQQGWHDPGAMQAARHGGDFPWKQLDTPAANFNVLISAAVASSASPHNSVMANLPPPAVFPAAMWPSSSLVGPPAAIPYTATHPNLSSAPPPPTIGAPFSPQPFYAARGTPILDRRPLRT